MVFARGALICSAFAEVFVPEKGEGKKSEKCNQGEIPENMSEQTRPGKKARS
jgi:Fe-S-cluster containining protein